MPPKFSVFEVLILIGITQGFVIAILIWLKRNKSISKVLLSLILITFNFLCIKILIHTTGLWQTQIFRYWPLPFDLAIQPLIWLYFFSLIKSGFKIRKRHLLHFIPFAFSFAYSLYVYISVASFKELAAKDFIANSLYFNKIKKTEDYISIVSSLIYWFMGLRLVLLYRLWLYNNISDTNYPTYTWLKNISILMGFLICGLTIAISLDNFFDFGVRHFVHWQVFFVYLAILIYYLGFRGYQLSDKYHIGTKTEEHQPKKQQVFIENTYYYTALPTTSEEHQINLPSELKVSEERAQQVTEAILKALEESELYLDPELNLQKLAKEVNTSPAIVSAVINNKFKKSFRNLINEYRVKKVKQRLKDSKSKHLSISGIAYESGFNSEASFYRIFKATVGVSPKDYMKDTTP